MFEIGAALAAAREARGLDLRDAERLTCMRLRYLTALENNRFDDLPGRTYARAFLRTYASALGLNADRFIAEFDEQVPEPEEPALPPPRRAPRAIPLRLAPVAAVLAIAVALVWSAWSNDHLSSNTVVAPPPPAAASAAVTHHPAQVRAAHKTLRASGLAITAVSGRCWLQARRGGPTGAVLVQRTLQRGQTLHLAAARVWVRLGAPWNVRIRRGATVHRLAPTTRPVNVLL